MSTITTTNTIGFRYALFGVSQAARHKIDGATFGFPATPSYNRMESVLSPAGANNTPPATQITATVKSVLFLRTSGRVKVRVTREDTTYYEQIVTSVFMLSPDAQVTVTITTAETYNVPALVVWS